MLKNTNVYKQEEGEFKGAGGIKLFYQTWTPAEVRGHLVITHGQGEHSDCYLRLVDGLSNVGVKIWAWDLRGHGKSQGVRGSVRDFDQYIQDYEIFLKRVVYPEAQAKPLILLGHSMGGLIQLRAVRFDEDLRELPQVVSAPMLGVAMEVPGWKAALSSVAYEVVPELGLDNGIKPEMLTSDPTIQAEYLRDPLRHNKISAGAYEGSKPAIEAVMKNPEYFTGPLLMVGPEEDPIVSSSAFKEFASRVPAETSELHLFPKMRHEIFNDVGRENVYKVVAKFLKAQL